LLSLSSREGTYMGPFCLGGVCFEVSLLAMMDWRCNDDGTNVDDEQSSKLGRYDSAGTRIIRVRVDAL
jgi:hypothetical protein